MANDTAEQTAAPEPFGFQNIIGESPVLREAVRLAQQVAGARRTTVLLIGETGTGKELFARGIHYASPAADEPFVAINCAAIPDSLLESELFGHERGAFTGAHSRKQGLLELAGSGTVFLDEVHHLPPLLQPKLLRALESRQIRRLGGYDEIAIECRVVAAASPILEQVVTSGEFREDLYYRLNVFTIELPPLRERKEDVALLVQAFLNEFNARNSKAVKGVDQDAMRLLESYGWPGNIRELRNVIERATILAGGDLIEPAHLPPTLTHAKKDDPAATVLLTPGMTVDEAETRLIRLTLEHTRENKTRAAEILGISLKTLHNKLNRLKAQEAALPSPELNAEG